MRLINSLIVCSSALFPCSLSWSAPTASTIGATYPIEERSAYDEIAERASRVNLKDHLDPDMRNWSGMRSYGLPRVTETKTREYVPLYELPFDIPNRDGTILYPKGYMFNPLEYIPIKQRVLVFDGSVEELAWVRVHHKVGDMVLVAGGDAIKMSDELGDPVFIFTEPLKERLGVNATPSLVEQDGAKFVIQEMKVERIEHEKR